FADKPTFFNLLLLVGATSFGFFAPNGIVDNRRNKRKLEIRNSVSDTIDQLNVMVRAGLGIDSALTRVTDYNTGPLADEFARALQEMRFGLTRNVALANLAERTDVPELKGFVAALSNADRLGVSVSQTLKVQAEDLRDRRRQLAEEQAMKLPVKILFPTVFCIMPALFIVLLGPAAIRIFEQFNS
ncbi:MAG TPA: type II secretion system F family protein, partial [Ilumatobacteraceae bacterium]|nr:type II secretion system F family protein [Ilumatobacteraceae bacterium]